MKGKWGRLYNPVMGENGHIVVRLRDTRQPMHSGNLEYAPGAEYTTKEKAEELAGKLNEVDDEGIN